ncbi:MAG: xanthine dehydrogenase family protein molybdopterin-binding subunit [Pseudomonadales bacterium]|jgi:isoquinoline 1-oxidoreductase/isoquinoline 1-oxidoreductase beta subunit|nr:xanthine dehydrogenase family protein molybdopterin-binding subunit [Pseudomonadales bacterium]MDP7359400.1 xanthine dehydrogenase family protein molybdopterin-binding subunit [Pseudomonadales bacterium]MDP7596380.1 xanthine dehydrogenase family protein molybdopterin-binding subunit [Pseudomonadales bacterium]
MSGVEITRRKFLVGSTTAVGGLALGISFTGQKVEALPNVTDGALQPNAWLQIRPDNKIVFQLDKTEMGQGVIASMPAILAEELEVDPRDMVVELAPVHGDFQDPMQMTGGSSSTRTRWDVLRETGAKARTMLIAAAAAKWEVPLDQCVAREGRIHLTGSDRSATYGELANDAAKLPIPKEVSFKNPADYRYVGKPLRRVDSIAKSTGTAEFGLDVRVPDALTAVVLRNPHFGGPIDSFDTTEAEEMPGVTNILQISAGIAVVADTYWHARKAADKVTVAWNKGPLEHVSSDWIRSTWEEQAKQEGKSVRSDGEGMQGLDLAADVTTAVYEVPYLAHATMEPMNTTARVTPDSIEVWSPNQGPQIVQSLVADALDVPLDQVTVYSTLMGGGFGRRGIPDYAVDPVEISKALGQPVKVVWSREDDMRHDYYRPATYNLLKAGVDDRGKVQTWTHRIVAPSIMATLIPTMSVMAPQWMPDWLTTLLVRGAGSLMKTRDASSHEGAGDHPYQIDNIEVEHVYFDPGIPLGFWRSVGHSQNAFVIESFIDELAYKAKEDPYEFRRRLLAGNDRLLTVLNLAAEKAAWGTVKDGISEGIAIHESFGSVVAEVAEVSVDNNKIKVERVVCVVDCGLAVNPDIVKAQMESGIVFGLTAALKGEININEGSVVESNFHDYKMLRMNESPKIEVYIIPHDDKPTGVGEPGTPPIAPAVANAVYAATGQRIRRLPLRLS